MKKPVITLMLVMLTVAFSTSSYAEKRFSREDQQLLKDYERLERGSKDKRNRSNSSPTKHRKQIAPPRRPQVYRAPAHRPPVRKPQVYRAPVHRPPVHRPPVYRAPVHRPPVHRPSVTRHGNVYERKAQLQRKIQKGERSGELVHSERKRLNAELRKISRLIETYRSDGVFDRRERSQINYMLDAAERNIERKRNNHLRDRYRR